MKESSSFKAKLKKADPDIRQYISELQTRNAKLHRETVKLEAQKVDRDNKIKALKKQIKENAPQVHYSLNLGSHEPTLAELDEKARKLGYRLEKAI